MKDAIEIRPMSIRLCPDCFCSYVVEHQNGKGRCGGCGSLKEFESFWTDEDGDILFKAVSDKRALNGR